MNTFRRLWPDKTPCGLTVCSHTLVQHLAVYTKYVARGSGKIHRLLILRPEIYKKKGQCLATIDIPDDTHTDIYTERHVQSLLQIRINKYIHYTGILQTELIVNLFIRCTMRCKIWIQPAELPW